MDKILINSFKDFDNYRVVEGKCGAVVSVSFKQIFLETNKTRIEEAVKMFNAIGGNFEYKPVKIIDTLDKWEEFQEVISKDGLMFSRDKKMFVSVKIIREGLYITELGPTKIVDVEKKYNVELKILK